MRSILVLVLLFLLGCSPVWEESPYEVYWIDGNQYLGYNVGSNGFISRVEAPENIASNSQYISVYACPLEQCSFYYIDKIKDHKFAEHDEFVYGPFTKLQFFNLVDSLGLPKLTTE